jgi:hypothetical protein
MPDTQPKPELPTRREFQDLIDSNHQLAGMIPALEALLAIEKERGVADRLDQMITEIKGVAGQMSGAATLMSEAIEGLRKEGERRDERDREMVELMTLMHEQLRRLG